jgi:hypothetical protein
MLLALVLTRSSKENFSDLGHLNTVQTFLAHQIQVPVLAGGFSNFALRAKASALFDLAAKVASSWNAGELTEGLLLFAFHFTRVFFRSRCGVDPDIRTRHVVGGGLDQSFHREHHFSAPNGGNSCL